MSKERIAFIDIVRGILILLVVLGHTGFAYSRYIYWFHMPAFFILSGMFLPREANKRLALESIKAHATRFFVPYISYFILISVVFFFFNTDLNIVNLLIRFLFGGRLLVGVYGIFWFTTCLFISQYLFFIIQSLRLSVIYVVLMLIVFYFIGVYAAEFFKINYIPFNADVSLVAVSYLFIGYFLNNTFTFILENKRWRLTTLILIAPLMILFVLTDLYIMPGFYELDMKYAQFNNIATDFVIPVVFLGGVMMLSFYLSKFNFISNALSFLGRNTLPIMYLHLLVIALLKTVGIELISIRFLCGVAAPMIIAFLFNQNAVARFLFNGTSSKKV